MAIPAAALLNGGAIAKALYEHRKDIQSAITLIIDLRKGRDSESSRKQLDELQAKLIDAERLAEALASSSDELRADLILARSALRRQQQVSLLSIGVAAILATITAALLLHFLRF